MKRYTIGALFNGQLSQIVVIKKEKPEWQAGRVNLPGGHIEEAETPQQCISREFMEKTSLQIPIDKWYLIGEIQGSGYECFFLTAIYEPEYGKVMKTTNESVGWVFVNLLPIEALSNLNWLIPFAINCHRQGNRDFLKYGIFKYEDNQLI